jgi:hypothetical protein
MTKPGRRLAPNKAERLGGRENQTRTQVFEGNR